MNAIVSVRALYGSPPPVRRVLPGRRRQDRLSRLTSARAERAPTTRTPRRRRTAHLRWSGEDSLRTPRQALMSGPPLLARRGRSTEWERKFQERLTSAGAERALRPPLAWTGRTGRTVHRRGCRLTSARAERTSSRRGASAGGLAHLRSRGEDSSSAGVFPSCVGSLRSCGEDFGRLVAIDPLDGSPPPSGEGPFDLRSGVTGLRLISAHAERTRVCRSACAWSPAHLRSRGEGPHEGSAAAARPVLLHSRGEDSWRRS